MTWNRRLGFLTGVPGFADAIRYQLGGMPHEIEYPNGVTWRQTAEAATGWERPDNIQTLTSAGEPSVVDRRLQLRRRRATSPAIGDRNYVYDKFSRFAYVHSTGQPQHEQQATYDAYGNLTALAKNGNTRRTLTTNAATNRLATPASRLHLERRAGRKRRSTAIAFPYGYDGLGQQLFQQTPSKTWVLRLRRERRKDPQLGMRRRSLRRRHELRALHPARPRRRGAAGLRRAVRVRAEVEGRLRLPRRPAARPG